MHTNTRQFESISVTSSYLSHFLPKQPQQAHSPKHESFVATGLAKILRPLLKRQPFQQKQLHAAALQAEWRGSLFKVCQIPS